MHPIFRTLECLGSILQKTKLRDTAPFLAEMDLKIFDVFQLCRVHKVGQCGPCATGTQIPGWVPLYEHAKVFLEVRS